MGETYARLDELRAISPQLANHMVRAEKILSTEFKEYGFVEFRKFTEELVRLVAAAIDPPLSPGERESAFEFLKRVQDRRVIPKPVLDHLHKVRGKGNEGAHEAEVGSEEVQTRAFAIADWFLDFSKTQRKTEKINGIEHLRAFSPGLAEQLQNAVDILVGNIEHPKGNLYGLIELRTFSRTAMALVGAGLNPPIPVEGAEKSTQKADELARNLEQAGVLTEDAARAVRELRLVDVKYLENVSDAEGAEFVGQFSERAFRSACTIADWYLQRCGFKPKRPKVRWVRGTLDVPPDQDKTPLHSSTTEGPIPVDASRVDDSDTPRAIGNKALPERLIIASALGIGLAIIIVTGVALSHTGAVAPELVPKPTVAVATPVVRTQPVPAEPAPIFTIDPTPASTIVVRVVGFRTILPPGLTYRLDLPAADVAFHLKRGGVTIHNEYGTPLETCKSDDFTIEHPISDQGLLITPCGDDLADFVVTKIMPRPLPSQTPSVVATPTPEQMSPQALSPTRTPDPDTQEKVPTPTPTPSLPELVMWQPGEYRMLEANIWYRFRIPYGSSVFLVKLGGVYVKDDSGKILVNCDHHAVSLNHPQGAPDLVIVPCDGLDAQLYALTVGGRVIPEVTAQVPSAQSATVPAIQIPQIKIPKVFRETGILGNGGGWHDPRYH